jgi:hypothetical protein
MIVKREIMNVKQTQIHPCQCQPGVAAEALVQSRNGEFEFAGMLFHQLLEASEGHMHRLGTGLDTEDSRRFIN